MAFVDIEKYPRVKAAVIFPEVVGEYTALSSEARLEEISGLALAINLDVVFREIIKIRTVKPSTFIGQGALDKILPLVEQGVELLVIDTRLSPIQQRNLEKKLGLKVIDRTALILEIFGERAQTKEGKLQVELAHLTYQRSRLVRSWTHLERQRGGAGFLGGPGETQIELDRRIIDDKIIRIKKDLEKVRLTRSIQRSSRLKVPYPIVALVGYTNAGKSTLFNRLSDSNVFAKDLLFATLDTSMRKITLPSGRDVILSDTVGFISDLPHELVMAFRATLEEVLNADLVVHVRDIAGENSREQKQDVLKVLESLGFQNIEEDRRYIEVLNKIDILDMERKHDLSLNKKTYMAPLSAISGEGCADFLQLIDDKLSADYDVIELEVGASNGKLIAWIYDNTEVLTNVIKEDRIRFKIKLDVATNSKLQKMLA
ncbi:MAG: GTPase HflX [Alphaproteobacteria bacterium]|nr:GTPase HflX [Alphaproteobacteria bacterium]